MPVTPRPTRTPNGVNVPSLANLVMGDSGTRAAYRSSCECPLCTSRLHAVNRPTGAAGRLCGRLARPYWDGSFQYATEDDPRTMRTIPGYLCADCADSLLAPWGAPIATGSVSDPHPINGELELQRSNALDRLISIISGSPSGRLPSDDVIVPGSAEFRAADPDPAATIEKNLSFLRASFARDSDQTVVYLRSKEICILMESLSEGRKTGDVWNLPQGGPTANLRNLIPSSVRLSTLLWKGLSHCSLGTGVTLRGKILISPERLKECAQALRTQGETLLRNYSAAIRIEVNITADEPILRFRTPSETANGR